MRMRSLRWIGVGLVLCHGVVLAGPFEDAALAFDRHDFAKSRALLQPLAAGDHAAAAELLGRLYEQGSGVPRDLATAARWWRKAAEEGDARAQLELGLALLKGEGATADSAAGLEWLRRSADGGYAPAQERLGSLYFLGFAGLARDPVAAVAWWAKAAERGDGNAQFSLGRMYAGQFPPERSGVARDEVAAYKWFSLSARTPGIQQDDAAEALESLSRRLSPADLARARKLLAGASRP